MTDLVGRAVLVFCTVSNCYIKVAAGFDGDGARCIGPAVRHLLNICVAKVVDNGLRRFHSFRSDFRVPVCPEVGNDRGGGHRCDDRQDSERYKYFNEGEAAVRDHFALI